MRDYRPRTRKKAAHGRHVPGWGMLLIGLAIGLFIAFLVYLERLSDAPRQQAAKAPAPAAQPAVKPRFEFYSILPELEVVIPDVLTENRGAAGEGGEPERDGQVYFLQAGSFKSTEEADRMKASLALLGLDVMIQSVSVNDVRWHRVRVGPLRTAEALREARGRLRENDIDFMLLKTGG